MLRVEQRLVSRREASSPFLRRSCRSCISARTSAVTHPIRCAVASPYPAGSGAAEGVKERRVAAVGV